MTDAPSLSPDFSPALDLLDEVVWILAPGSWAPRYVNAHVEQVYGRPAREFLADPDLRLRVIDAQDLEMVRERLASLTPASPAEIEYRIEWPDGQTRWVRERLRLVADGAGAGTSVVAVAADVTDRLRAHHAVREAREKAAEQEVLHLVEMARKNDALQQVYVERRRSEKVRTVLAAVSEQLNAASSPHDAAQVILQAADTLFGWDAALVDVYDSAAGLFYGVVRYDLVDDKRTEIPPLPGGTPFTPLRRRLFDEGPLLILRGAGAGRGEDGLVGFGEGGRKSASLMFAPIYKGERKAGMISVQSYTPDFYTQPDLELFQVLANYCCTGLERTFAELRLHQAERRLRWLLGVSPALLWTTDAELRMTSLVRAGSNPDAPREPMLVPLARVFPDTDVAQLEQLHRRALQGETAEAQLRLSGVTHRCRVEPLMGETGASHQDCLGIAYPV